jgi:hypothetical protein
VSTASSYTWTLPSDWTGTSNSNSINALAGSTSGNISVTANNTCGSSIPQTLTVTTNNAPAIPSIINGSTTICENATETYSVNPDPNANTYQWTIPNGWTGTSTSDLISITTNTLGGVISVSATNGCGTSAFQTLNIFLTNVPPTLDPIIGSTALCAGTTTYSVPIMAGAASYEWNLPIGWTGTSTTNSIDVTTSAGTGTIQVSAVNGCGNSVPQTLAVTINAVPNVLLDLTPIAIQCSSETAVTLVGGTPAGGVYAGSSVGGGIFNPSLAGVGNHIIQYSFVDANTCSAFAYDTIMVDVCIGVDEIANTSVKAYPNPGNGLINIVVDGKLNLVPCEIYNAAGMSVKSFILSNTNNIIDLSEFANGLYLVKMQIDEKLETMRYIKN